MLNIIIDSPINLTCKSDDLQYVQQHQYTVLTNQPQKCQSLSCIILGLKAKPINPRLVISLAFAATETTFM